MKTVSFSDKKLTQLRKVHLTVDEAEDCVIVDEDSREESERVRIMQVI